MSLLPVYPLLPPTALIECLTRPALTWSIPPLALCGLLLALRAPGRRVPYLTRLGLLGALICGTAAVVGWVPPRPAVLLSLMALVTLVVDEIMVHVPTAVALVKFPGRLIYTHGRGGRGESRPVKPLEKHH